MPSDPSASPREILAAAIAGAGGGDERALAQVYALTSGKLNALLLRMLRDEAAAAEVLQDVYVTVWKRGMTFDPRRSSPITWLVTIARNRAIDRIRADGGARAWRALDAVTLVDPGPIASERLEGSDQARRLRECLAGLDERPRAAIERAFFGGLTYEALAAREGLPVGTVKSMIRRALSRLRACMEF